jgi:hypothetical protein
MAKDTKKKSTKEPRDKAVAAGKAIAPAVPGMQGTMSAMAKRRAEIDRQMKEMNY